VRLDLDASCNENGPNLFSNPATCLLVPIIVKCDKLMTMEAQTHFNSSTSTCFINKKLVQQYKLALVEKNTLVLIKVIDGHSLSLGPIAHETKALNVTIGFHINKVVFNVISFIRNIVIIGLFWLALYNIRVDWHTKSLHFETPKHEAMECETFIRSMHGKNQDG